MARCIPKSLLSPRSPCCPVAALLGEPLSFLAHFGPETQEKKRTVTKETDENETTTASVPSESVSAITHKSICLAQNN